MSGGGGGVAGRRETGRIKARGEREAEGDGAGCGSICARGRREKNEER